jgi:hypothetical protein
MAPLRKLLLVLLALNLAVSAIDLIDEIRDHSERNRQIEALQKMTSDVEVLDGKLAVLEERHGKRLDEQRLQLERLQDESQRLIKRFHHEKLRWRKKTIMVVLASLAFLICLQNKKLFAEGASGLPQSAT